jgi:S-methylmethionine-dependent homocysteine/selenocysteine methylase
MTFQDTISHASFALAEGSLRERLHRDPMITLDPHVDHAGFVCDPTGRAVLERLYREYLDIGRVADIPFIVCTPTHRANPERLRKAGFGEQTDVNGDGFRFLSTIRDSYGRYAKRIFIGGLMGCRGDAYSPGDAMDSEDAASFHEQQACILSDAGVDFLMAATQPAAGEALGLARAMAASGAAYVVSFIIRPAGRLLDGTPLHKAISMIDGTVNPAPMGYMVNCVHPAVLLEALNQSVKSSPGLCERLLGLQGNTSTKSPEELDNLDHLDAAQDPEEFAAAMVDVQRRFGVKILGGCCGTDARHIQAIARRLKTQVERTD